jgi:putative DNA primase/helicase
MPAETEDCPLWLKFLSEVQPPEGIDYLQRLVGYFLTGSVKEEIFPLFYGEGQNGKGTFVKTIFHMLGGYAGVLPASTFVKSKNQEHPTGLAKLEGLRLASASETAEGFWNEQRLKSLTGGDKIAGRKMRQDYSDFEPTHKLLIDTNNKPSLAKIDKGMRRRFHLVPFTVTIPEDKRDLELKEKLVAEVPGILSWAIDGALQWQRDGLKTPAIVTDATDKYFQEQDLLGQWLETRMDIGDGYQTSSQVYFPNWCEFCKLNGEDPGTQRGLTEKLKAKGFKPCLIGHFKDSGLSGFRFKSGTLIDLSDMIEPTTG